MVKIKDVISILPNITWTDRKSLISCCPTKCQPQLPSWKCPEVNTEEFSPVFTCHRIFQLLLSYFGKWKICRFPTQLPPSRSALQLYQLGGLGPGLVSWSPVSSLCRFYGIKEICPLLIPTHALSKLLPTWKETSDIKEKALNNWGPSYTPRALGLTLRSLMSRTIPEKRLMGKSRATTEKKPYDSFSGSHRSGS